MGLFGFNKKNKEPKFRITEPDRNWVEENFKWLIQVYGYPTRQDEQLIISDKYFPKSFSNKNLIIQNLIEDLCNLLGLNSNKVNFETHEDLRDVYGMSFASEGKQSQIINIYKMKQIYTIISFLLIHFALSAQTVTITGSCGVDGDYIQTGVINGRPSYTYLNHIILWTGSQWQQMENPIGIPPQLIIGMINTLDCPKPPASSLSPWTPYFCDPPGIFSGDGTCSTLSVSDAQLTNSRITLFPNPSTDFIQISGLNKIVKYRIFNVYGSELDNGRINNHENVDIQNLTKGLYFIKLDNKHTRKFVKK